MASGGVRLEQEMLLQLAGGVGLCSLSHVLFPSLVLLRCVQDRQRLHLRGAHLPDRCVLLTVVSLLVLLGNSAESFATDIFSRSSLLLIAFFLVAKQPERKGQTSSSAFLHLLLNHSHVGMTSFATDISFLVASIAHRFRLVHKHAEREGRTLSSAFLRL